MSPRPLLPLCLLACLMDLPLASQECQDWIPRFELVLHENTRGEFYENEPIVVDIWVADVCPEVLSRIDVARFFLLRDCVSWIPDCSAYFHGGSCCRYTDGRRAGDCTGGGGCGGELNESVAGTMGNNIPQCGESLPVPPDGRVLLGTTDLTYGGALDGPTVESLTVGDANSQTGVVCIERKSAIQLWDRGQAVISLHPEDSQAIFIKVRQRPFIRGDANQDGVVDLSDAILVLSLLFLGSPRIFQCVNAADVDDNNRHEITDAIALLTYLFVGGAPPVAPFPEPGYDQTPITPAAASQSGCSSGVFL